MTDATLEQNLQAFDYSVFSKVKGSLLAELLKRHDADNSRRISGLSRMLTSEMMTDEELDFVAAAGNPALSKKNS